MTYKQAVERLRELADGRDWCLAHETGSYIGQAGGVQITAYIQGLGHANAAVTYGEAIRNMEVLLDIRAVQTPDAPPEDNKEAKLLWF